MATVSLTNFSLSISCQHPSNILLDIYPDFFPWRKTRDEDTLATQYLQKGYNPTPCVPNEAFPARSAMLSILKQRSSFYALSYFMLGAMEVKEKCNRITSNSTFKPPPRVTLTEQKKEAWLRDLANPSVPLRRLSRTIPHGTRNRSLLEQCCNKSIPIPRAVWFARCVGANELRGLKRKGSSQVGPVTEAQWVHEWTDQVTEFIEKVIKECSNANNTNSTNISVLPTSPNNTTTSTAGSPSSSTQSKVPSKTVAKPYNSPSSTVGKLASSNPQHQPWKNKMEYMIRLSASLFSEGLLDKPLFLKWCVINFQRCKLDELPVALLFLRLFWNGIVQSRILSQNLALALLERFSELSAPNLIKHSIFSSVRDKVCEYLQHFFLLSSDSFVFPNHWKEMGPILSEALKNIDNDIVQQLLDLTCTRNESLIVTDASSVRALRNPKYLIIDALDKAQVPYNWSFIAQNIHSNKISEHEALTTAFEWAITNNRTGIERIYICSSLLTEWHDHQKWEISDAFLNFLDNVTNPDEYVMENLYDLVSEFLDRDWFHPSTFFRRLISQGILFINRLRPSVLVKVNILANLPLHYSSSLRNQQIMLLKGLKMYDDNSRNNLQNAKAMLLTHLDFLAPDYDFSNSAYLELSQLETQSLTNLTKGDQLELSTWIFKSFDTKLVQGLEISVSQFAILQNVLEILRDYKSIYIFIEALVSQTSNGTLLYFMANTTRDHLAIFASIGDVIQLVQLFVTQYKSLKVKSKMSKGLFDLTNFALSQLPESNTQLRAELEQFVCPAGQSPLKDITTLSPMSDGVSEGSIVNQEFGELFQEQLGTQDIIDIRTLPKLFALASQKFLKSCQAGENCDNLRKMALILQHLRDIDLNMFTELLMKWIRDEVEPALSYDSNAYTQVLLFLVIYECLTFEKAGNFFLQPQSVKLPGSIQGTKLMLSLISEDYPVGNQLKASEKLTLNMQRRQFERNHASTYLQYVYQEILDSTESRSTLINNSVSMFLLWLSTSDPTLLINNLINPIFETGNAQASNSLRLILVHLLKFGSPNQNPKIEILHLLEIFNHLNLGLCQIYIRVVLMCQWNLLKSTGTSNSEENILGTILEVISGAQTYGLSERALGDLMIHLPSEIKPKLLAKCELLFIQSSHFPRVVNMDTGKGNILLYLLEVVDAIADSVELNLFETNSFEITESFDKLLVECENYSEPDHSSNSASTYTEESAEASSDKGEDSSTSSDNTNSSGVDKNLRSAILLFVKIIMIHSPRPSEAKGWNESLRHKLTTGLIRILGTSFLANNSDMYGLLVDTLDTIKGDFSSGVSVEDVTSASRLGSSATSLAVVGPPPSMAAHGDNSSLSVLANISPAVLAAGQRPSSSGSTGSSSSNGSDSTTSETAYLADLIMYNKATKTYSALNVRSFDLLEESNHTMAVNDVALNLAMFDGFIEKKNPL